MGTSQECCGYVKTPLLINSKFKKFRMAGRGYISGFVKRVLMGKSTRKEIFVGQDEHGNKYYETIFTGSLQNKKPKRHVQGISRDLFEVPSVPVEWMTWLQGRRDDPPTDEERTRNYATMVKTLKRADDLQQERMGEDIQKDAEKANEVVIPEEEAKFPERKEYEFAPGQHYDRDKKQ